MSKIMNYLKKNQNDIAVTMMMSANSLLPGANVNWKLIEECRKQK